MKILIVCEPGQVMLVGEGGRISEIVPGPQETKGNPYLVFGLIIQELFGVRALETTLTVATVTSGSLKTLIVSANMLRPAELPSCPESGDGGGG